MAEKKFLVDLNLGGNKAKNFRLEDYVDNTAPTSNFVGRMIYTTNGNNSDRLELYTADGWKQVAYIDDTPPLDQDLVDIAALTGDGFLVRQSGVWAMDTNTYLTSAVTSLTGTSNQIDVSDSTGDVTLSLPNTIYRETTSSYGYYAGFDITFSGDTGDTYLNQTTGDGNIYALGAFNVSYGGTNDPQYNAFHVDPGSATTDIRNVLQVHSDTNVNAFVINGNASTFLMRDAATDTDVLTLGNSDQNAMITANTALNLYSNGGGIYLNPTSNVEINGHTNINNDVYVKDGIYVGGDNDATNGYINIQDLGGNNVITATAYDGGGTLEIHGSQHFYADGGGNEYLRITHDPYQNAFVNAWNNNLVLQADGNVFLWNPNTWTNRVATLGDITDGGNSITAPQFIAGLLDIGNTGYNGYTFVNDGGLDTGMLSDGDGSVRFYANAQDIFDFNTGGVTFNTDVTVTGNLNVEGTLNAINRTEVNIEDNTIVLNTSFTGVPTTDAGITVERGDYTDASLYWNETANAWYVGTVGDNTDAAVATALSLAGHTHTASNITDFNTAIDSHLSGSNSISYSAGTIDTTLATTSYLSKSSGLAVDISSLETKLVTDSFVKKYAETISGSATSYEITHSLGTRDVTVQVYETASPYGQIETAVEYTTTNKVTVYFNSAPTSGDYRVVVTG